MTNEQIERAAEVYATQKTEQDVPESYGEMTHRRVAMLFDSYDIEQAYEDGANFATSHQWVSVSERLPNCLKNSMLTMNTEYIAEVFQWLLRRYCLVEKERVKDEYYEAKFACGNIDPCSETWATYQAQKSVLERLFPEIAKEVEG